MWKHPNISSRGTKPVEPSYEGIRTENKKNETVTMRISKNLDTNLFVYD
jgi:hypothetical protein